MSFEMLLEEHSNHLHEATMTPKQRVMVASLRSNGWRVVDIDDSRVSITDGSMIRSINRNGEIEHLNESYTSPSSFIDRVNIDYLNEALLQVVNEAEYTPDDVVGEEKENVKKGLSKILENLVIVTLVRGKETYVVAMTRHNNEYMKVVNNDVTDHGVFSNRRTAMDLVNRLKQSGFDEADFGSTIPKRIHKTMGFLKDHLPTLSIIALLLLINPLGWVSALISFAVRASWSLIGFLIDKLGLPSISVLTDEVESAMQTLNIS